MKYVRRRDSKNRVYYVAVRKDGKVRRISKEAYKRLKHRRRRK